MAVKDNAGSVVNYIPKIKAPETFNSSCCCLTIRYLFFVTRNDKTGKAVSVQGDPSHP